MTRLRALLALLAFALLAASPARAEERILRFSSEVQINADGSLDVTETIDVRAENVRINRGIFRDFPTRYRAPGGGQVRVGFKLVGVTRDGMTEPAALEALARGVRVRIGDPDRMIDPGSHRYVIRYRTTRQIGFFREFDELYWNVTGNGWVFPIDEAGVRIRLPSASRFGQRAAYTGVEGSRERAARVDEERPGEIHFVTTRPLAAREGLTVAVAFPKGIVAPAGKEQRTRDWLTDYGPLLVGLLGLVGIAAYYLFAWTRVGRDPRAGTVVPLFSPPDGLTPAAMRYVWKMGTDNRAFAAALVDLGVRGHVRMMEEDGGLFGGDKVRLQRVEAPAALPAAEEAMLRELARTGETVVMEQKNHAKFSAAQSALDDAFKAEFAGKLFHFNWGWALAGLPIVFAAIWVTAAAVAAAAGVVDLNIVLLSAGSLGVAAVLFGLAQVSASTGRCLFVALGLLFAALAIFAGLPVLKGALDSGWIAPLLIPASGLILAISAFFWISAPTREGRSVLDRIAGFRQYLSVTEGERLDRMTPPKETPELFERYLPYAIALGVENRWAKRFQGVLAAAAAQGHSQFAWYAGSNDPWDNPGGFVKSVGSGLSSTLSSASTAPGSGSGSGGGGSSGGGGGGGGGGGW